MSLVIVFITVLVLTVFQTTYCFNKFVAGSGKLSSIRTRNSANLLISFAKRRTKIAPRIKDISESRTDESEMEDSDPIGDNFQNNMENSLPNVQRTVVFQKKGLIEELEDDIGDFSSAEKNNKMTKEKDFTNGVGGKIKDIFSGILIADFFLIVFFLIWFIAASVSKEAFANAFLLEKFQDIFQPIIQPALGLLMAGSVASGIFKNDDEKDK
eukprot:gene7791-15940_t